MADFTYVSTWQGFIYVAFVIDVFARRIVGTLKHHFEWAAVDYTTQGDT